MKKVNHIKKIIALITIIASMQISVAQQRKATTLDDIAETNLHTAWIHFKPESKIEAATIFEKYKFNFGLSAQDEMKLFRTNKMPFEGLVINRYQQYHNGYKVIGATINIHERDGIAQKANGRLLKNFNSSISVPAYTETNALNNALQFIPAKDYAWLDTRKVAKVRAKKNDPTITLYPKGELVYVQPKGKKDFEAADFILCWKFDVAMSRSNSQRVFINANTGSVVNSYPLDATCSGTTIDLPYNGNRTVYTSQQGRCANGNYYEMWDDCQSAYIHVEDYDTGDPKCNYVPGNTWTGLIGTTSDAAQINWGMRQTYNYHLNNFSWTSYDDASGSIDCTSGFNFIDDNGQVSGNNARWTWVDEDFDFGYGASGIADDDSYTTLDIVAHEFTHGVDEYSANLDYSGESGALDESFADIFGEIVEQSIENNWATPSWTLAEDLTNKDYIRSFIAPKIKGDPDTYLGTNWYTGSDGNKEVHTNSGVQNHFFYVLVEGKSGVNDLGNQYNVSGIGINDAKDIAWLAHQYLFDAAQYIDSRDAWLEAAGYLFGSCSNQAIQVGNAWHAVGVGAQSPFYTKFATGTLTAGVSNKLYEAISHVYSVALTTVNSTSGAKEVRFYAGDEVTLNTGFTAPSGCAFVAKINPCSVTLHSRNSNAANAEVNETPANFESPNPMSVVPNPFQNSFTCRLTSANDNENVTITIYDAMGKSAILQKRIIAQGRNELLVDASTLLPGIYHVQITTDSGNTYQQKILKQ
ncbi:MAG: M4 family metallopeptidase [Bacteroidetes bacterium]|nr:M4 family metallopeptidase [Bacteroidota bacterium]